MALLKDLLKTAKGIGERKLPRANTDPKLEAARRQVQRLDDEEELKSLRKEFASRIKEKRNQQLFGIGKKIEEGGILTKKEESTVATEARQYEKAYAREEKRQAKAKLKRQKAKWTYQALQQIKKGKAPIKYKIRSTPRPTVKIQMYRRETPQRTGFFGTPTTGQSTYLTGNILNNNVGLIKKRKF